MTIDVLNAYPHEDGERKIIMFPVGPTDGQKFSDGDYVWQYVKNKWVIIGDGKREIVFNQPSQNNYPKTSSDTDTFYGFWTDKFWSSSYIGWFFALVVIILVVFNYTRTFIYSASVNSELETVAEVAHEMKLKGSEAIACFYSYTNNKATKIDIPIVFTNEESGKIIKCVDATRNWDSIKRTRASEVKNEQYINTVEAKFTNVVMTLPKEDKVTLLKTIDIWVFDDIDSVLKKLSIDHKNNLTIKAIKLLDEKKAEASKTTEKTVELTKNPAVQAAYNDYLRSVGVKSMDTVGETMAKLTPNQRSVLLEKLKQAESTPLRRPAPPPNEK